MTTCRRQGIAPSSNISLLKRESFKWNTLSCGKFPAAPQLRDSAGSPPFANFKIWRLEICPKAFMFLESTSKRTNHLKVILTRFDGNAIASNESTGPGDSPLRKDILTSVYAACLGSAGSLIVHPLNNVGHPGALNPVFSSWESCLC